MWRGREVLLELKQIGGENTEVYGYKNCRIRNSSLMHGVGLYEIGIAKFLGNSIISRLQKKAAGAKNIDDIRKALRPDSNIGLGRWNDLAGLLVPRTEVDRLMDDIEKGTIGLEAIQDRFREMHENYYSYEWTWALEKLEHIWKCKVDEVCLDKIMETIKAWKEAVVKLDEMVYEDARKEFDLNSQTGFGVDGDAAQQKKDFISVRGSFQHNPFVVAVKEHIRVKSELGDQMLEKLSGC